MITYATFYNGKSVVPVELVKTNVHAVKAGMVRNTFTVHLMLSECDIPAHIRWCVSHDFALQYHMTHCNALITPRN